MRFLVQSINRFDHNALKLPENGMKYPAFFVLALFTLFSCSNIQTPVYKEYRNLRIDKVGINQSSLSFDMVYFNPNRFSLSVKETEIDVYLEGKLLGHSSVPEKVFVPRESEFIIPVRIRADMGSLLKSGFFALLGKEVEVKATGSTRVGRSGLYVKYPILYEGMHRFKF